MKLNRLLLGVGICTLSLTSYAQTPLKADFQPMSAFSANIYKRPLGLNNIKHLPDNLLKEIGSRVSAQGHPSRLQAQKMLQAQPVQTNRRKANSQVVERLSAANYTANDTIFWESFEGWDGTTMPWLPTENKWTSRSNIADLTPYLTNDLCPTWTVYQGDGYYIPYATDADQMLVCMYGGEAYDAAGNVIAAAPQQDEWIVSPTVSAIEGSHYLSFDICYSPWDLHYFIEGKDTLFDMDRKTFDVELLVTTNTRTVSYDAANYDVVYRLSADADKLIASTDMDDADAVAELLYMNWHRIQIPLKDYDGKNIRFALRYTGSKGGSVLVDAMRVSDLLPVAKYDIPDGSFYYGFGESAELFSAKMGLVPAYVPTTWKNYSNADATEFVWNYKTPTGAEGTSTSRDLSMPALESSYLVEMPALKAVSGARSDEFQGMYYKAGGNAVYMNEGQQMNFYVGNFDPTKQYWLGQVSASASNPIYAFGTGGGQLYGQLSNYYYNAVDGIGNFYECPDAPYVFNKVLVPLGDYFNLGATLACTIYKVENGYTITDEVLAQATLTDGKQIAGGWFLEFEFEQPLVVDDAIFILIDGLNNSNLISFAPLTQALNHDSDKSYAFVKLLTTEGNFAIIDVANLLSSLEGGGNMSVSHCIGMNAVFPYLHSLDGDAFTVEDAGGKRSFAVDSYWNPSDWNISCSEAWFRATPVVDEAAQTVSIDVEADALPNGVSGRSGQVKVTALGCEQVITVLQGDAITGVQGVQIGESAYMDGTYTLSGQRIQSGKGQQGVYLTKKNGKFVKVINK